MKEILKKINVKKLLKYALYLFLSLMVQNMLLTRFRIFGTCPMVLPAVAVAIGMFEGPMAGTVASLVLGVFADMAFVENTILFTVMFPALAFTTGFIAQFYINRRFVAFLGAASFGLLTTAVVQMLGTAASDGWSITMIGVVIMQTLLSLPPAALAYFPPARWLDK